MIYVIATIQLKPGTAAGLRGAIAALVAATRAEDGCIAYEFFASLEDADRLVVVEKWVTREALTVHSKQPHMQVWRDASGPHLVSRRVEIVHPEKIEEH